MNELIVKYVKKDLLEIAKFRVIVANFQKAIKTLSAVKYAIFYVYLLLMYICRISDVLPDSNKSIHVPKSIKYLKGTYLNLWAFAVRPKPFLIFLETIRQDEAFLQ